MNHLRHLCFAFSASKFEIESFPSTSFDFTISLCIGRIHVDPSFLPIEFWKEKKIYISSLLLNVLSSSSPRNLKSNRFLPLLSFRFYNFSLHRSNMISNVDLSFLPIEFWKEKKYISSLLLNVLSSSSPRNLKSNCFPLFSILQFLSASIKYIPICPFFPSENSGN